MDPDRTQRAVFTAGPDSEGLGATAEVDSSFGCRDGGAGFLLQGGYAHHGGGFPDEAHARL